MITENSIDLRKSTEPCWAVTTPKSRCPVSAAPSGKECGTWLCPFYKPDGCGDWIRVDDGKRCDLVPPEEYRIARKAQAERNRLAGVSIWRLISGKA